MKIDGREIGPDHEPYVIAELSGNHGGDIDNCMKLMQEAVRAGADAIKLQAYTPDTITFNGEGDGFVINDGPWAGKRLYDLYKEAHTPFEWFKPLFDYAKILKTTIFASVFDPTSVELLQRLDAPAYKISSFEITDIPLIHLAAKTGKPMIISTGMSTDREIKDAVLAFRKNAPFDDQLALLHCVSGYPTPASQANLPALGPLSSILGSAHQVGLSDHTLGIGVPVAAVAFGATIVERHLTLDRSAGGPDAAFSSEPHEFKAMVEAVKQAWQAIKPSKSQVQDQNRSYRKSLYIVADVLKGGELTKENVRAIRPAFGLPPSAYASVLGRLANQDLKAGTPLRLSHFETEE